MKKNKKTHRISGDKIIWMMIACYAAVFCLLTYLKYYSFGYHDWDFASDINILWNSVHGEMFCYSFLDQNIFGAHLYLIIPLIIPVFALFQHPLTLLFLQSIFLGLAAYPLYLFAVSKLNKPFAYAVSFIYLTLPSLGFINLFETHFEIYEIFFLFFAILYFERSDFKKFLVFILLALSCKENVSLAVFMFGFYAILRRRSLRWVLTPLLLGAAWFLLAVKMVIPFFNKDAQLYQEGFMFSVYYRHLGNSMLEIFKNIVTHPLAVLSFTFSPEKILYICQIFLTTSFLGFFSPGVLLMTLPIFAQNLLSLVSTHHQIHYQYVALIIPFVFVSCVWTLKKLLAIKFIYTYRNIFLISFLSVSLLAGVFLEAPQLYVPKYAKMFSINNQVKNEERLVKLIPPEASVIATFKFLPHLAMRRNIYSLHLVSVGYRMYTKEKYIVPDGLEYALVDFNELPGSGFFPAAAPENIRNFLKEGNWQVWDASDDLVLFRKDSANSGTLCQVVAQPDIENKLDINFAGQIAFLGYDVIRNPQTAGKALHFVYYWKRLGESVPELVVLLQFLDAQGKVVFQRAHSLGYRVYPPEIFSRDDIIREHCYISIPHNILKGSYGMRMALFTLENGQALPIVKDKQTVDSGIVLPGNIILE